MHTKPVRTIGHLLFAGLAAAFDPSCDSARAANTSIPCADAPRAAVVEVPATIAKFAQVVCTRYGHYLAGAKGTAWMYVGGTPAMIIADASLRPSKELPPELGHANHFTQISIRKLTAADSREFFVGALARTYGADAARRGVEILTTNQDGVVQKAYLFAIADLDPWGYLCRPDCKPNVPFSVMRMPQN